VTYQQRDAIAVGASAGSLAALQRLVNELPADLQAAVLIVVHVQRTAPSHLASILARSANMPVSTAEDGEPIVPGRILVAPPDWHLLVEDGRINLCREPLENGFRPAVDPLFRSAAAVYGRRLAAVVLSGSLDDGSAGLVSVRRHGGVGIVQDPWEARFPDMPRNALESDHPQYVEGAARIGQTLTRLARGEETPAAGDVRTLDVDDLEPRSGLAAGDVEGVPTGVACPECHGTMWTAGEGPQLRFRCRSGHSWDAAGTLRTDHADSVERALWAAVRALEEQASLARSLQRRTERGGGAAALTARYASRAEEAEREALVIRRLIMSPALGRAGEPRD
jgi:two-component system, chemotaxis family, protein-glutamate methylesterase/glutaminase